MTALVPFIHKPVWLVNEIILLFHLYLCVDVTRLALCEPGGCLASS